MLELLAQTPPATPVPHDWYQVLVVQGPLTVMFLIGVYFLIWYGPGLLNGHREMMQKVGDSLETLTANDTRQTKSLKHIVSAGEQMTDCPVVKEHLKKARRVLDDEELHS